MVWQREKVHAFCCHVCDAESGAMVSENKGHDQPCGGEKNES